jgi:hypothetical protein
MLKSIYKYMKFREEFFDNFAIKASRYGEFNYAFDLMPGDYALSLPEEEMSVFLDARSEYFDDPAWYIDNYVEVQSGARASLAVICFTEDYNNLLMWAHYADSHAGMCVEYDYRCDFFHGKYSDRYYDHVGVLKRVEYSQERPSYVCPSMLVNGTNQWFNKSKEWEYEQ